MKIIFHYDIKQGSDEWHKLKKGRMSSSHGTAIGNCGAGLTTYADEIVLGMITDTEGYYGKDMQRGTVFEPVAVQSYELIKNVQTTEIGFISYGDYVGCSPDRLVGIDGGLEIKTRNNLIHFRLLKTKKVDSGTIWQINMCMLISGRKWWDFGSYNPNFKQSLFIERFYPDQDKFDKLLAGFKIGEAKIKELLKNPNIINELKN